MEPFSLVAFVLGASVGGIIGNRVDYVFCQVMDVIINRLRQGGPLLNHDLQRAVRKAYLQATLAVCKALLKELGAAPSLWQRNLGVLLRPSDEIRWLDKVRGAISEELQRLPRAEYYAPSTEADKQVALLVQPKGINSDQRRNELCAMLKQSLLTELRQRHGEPPARFVEMVQNGWDDSEPNGTTTHLDWFDLLCAFFVHDLKTNERVRTIFEAQLLSQLTVEGPPLTLAQFEKLSEGMVKRLEQLDAHLAQLRTEQAEGFANIQGRLDEMLPTLALLPDIAAQQQVLTALLQEALREMRRRPDEVLRWLQQRFSNSPFVVTLQQRTQSFINRLCQKPFVPRQSAWEQLSEWVMRERSGVAVLYAPAGYGKTTLLANWVNALQSVGGIAIAYHFFSKDPDLGDYATKPMNAFAYLLGQIAAITQPDSTPIAFLNNPDERRAQLERTIAELKLVEGERLVIVLDGLDEADEVFHPPIQKPLPDGVFVVVSGRWDGAGDPPKYLVKWLAMADRTVRLDAMDEEEIAEWMRQFGDPELQDFAADHSFVQQLREKTGGLPLFLAFLLDDFQQAVKQGKDVLELLAQTPKSFSDYVKNQLIQLAPLVKSEQTLQMLFAILSVAKGALRENELQALMDLSPWNLFDLPYQVTRWWHIGEQDGERTYAFAHTLLATEVAKTLSKEAKEAKEKLLGWCARWPEHQSIYALRYYVAHLIDYGDLAGAVETLTDVKFIEARCRADLLQHHRQECEAIAGEIKDATQRKMLHTVASAIAIESPTLERFPELTFQTLVNSCRWVEAAWTQPLIQRWRSSWESSGRSIWLERLLPPREIPQKSPIAMVLADGYYCKALAFSSDGKYLAGAGGGSVIVWEVESGEKVCELKAPQFINGGLIDVSWSGDGRWIAAIGNLEGYLALWDFRDKELRFFEKVHDFGCTVSFCPEELRDPVYEGELLLTCGRDSFRLWSIRGDREEVIREDFRVSDEVLRFIQTMLGDTIPWEPPLTGAAWVRLDSRRVIAVAAESGQIVLLEGGLIPVARVNLRLSIHHVSATEDGRFIALVQDANEPPFPFRGEIIDNDHCFILIDNEKEQDISGYRLKGHVAKVSLLAAENRMLACEEDYGLATLWSLIPFGMIGSWQGPSLGLSAGALGKGNRIAVSTKVGSVMLLTPEAMSKHPKDFAGYVWSMSISSDGDSIVAARADHYLGSRFDGDLALVRLKNQEIISLESFKKRDAPLSVAYLPDGRFVTGHMDGTIRLWSSNGSLELKHLIRENVGIGDLCVSSSGDLVAVSCGTWYDPHEVPETIHVLQVADMSEVFTGSAGKKGFGGKPGNALAFGGRDCDLLICGGSPIRIWRKSDSGCWEIEAEIENDFGMIQDMAWSLYLGGFVFSYGSGHSAGLGLLRPTQTGWQKNRVKVGTIPVGLGVSECGRFIAWAGADKVCRFCRFEDDGSITVLAKHFIHATAGVYSAVVSWTHKLVAFGDANGDIHVFRYHE